MNQPKYQLKADDILSTYAFLSEGPKGKIEKLIQFTPTNYFDVFNLAFGDKDSKTGQIDDKVISNNGDSELVLATVVSAIYAFTEKHPDSWIYATGSTKSRTRLYRMGITKYLKEVKSDFEIFGEINKTWEHFEKEVDYEAFLVKRKKQ
jgi:hypothetical protein